MEALERYIHIRNNLNIERAYIFPRSSEILVNNWKAYFQNIPLCCKSYDVIPDPDFYRVRRAVYRFGIVPRTSFSTEMVKEIRESYI